MEDKHVRALAEQVSARLAAAKERLLAQMRALGLEPAEGWRITEELRHTVNGTEWVLRPVHLREPSPHLEERVAIDPSGRPESG